MGLEAGWNCHISLLSDKDFKCPSLENAVSQSELASRFSRHSSRHSSDATKDKNFSKLKSICFDKLQSRSRSAPSIVNLSSSQVRFEVSDAVMISKGILDETCIDGKQELLHDMDYQEENECFISNKDSDGESRHASSYLTENTEDSITGALDNRVIYIHDSDNYVL